MLLPINQFLPLKVLLLLLHCCLSSSLLLPLNAPTNDPAPFHASLFTAFAALLMPAAPPECSYQWPNPLSCCSIPSLRCFSYSLLLPLYALTNDLIPPFTCIAPAAPAALLIAGCSPWKLLPMTQFLLLRCCYMYLGRAYAAPPEISHKLPNSSSCVAASSKACCSPWKLLPMIQFLLSRCSSTQGPCFFTHSLLLPLKALTNDQIPPPTVLLFSTYSSCNIPWLWA
jgi:hypothetical protein